MLKNIPDICGCCEGTDSFITSSQCAFFFRAKATLLQPNGGNKCEFYLHEVTVRWKASAIICYHNNTLKHHTLSSHISPPASQSAVLGFSCFCRSHPSLKSSDMQTEPRGRLSVLDRGVKMVKTWSSVNFGTLSEGGVCRTALENSFCEIIVCVNRGKN